MKVELVAAEQPQKTVLRHLLELYLYEFSEIEESDVDDHGLYDYKWLDHYWTEPGHHPFLFRVDGRWAGLALVAEFSYFGDVVETTHAIAEFFVMRRYRRRGIGTQMACELFRRFPGRWEVAELTQNQPAQAFWRRVIDEFTHGRFEEHILDGETWRGPVQVFRCWPV